MKQTSDTVILFQLKIIQLTMIYECFLMRGFMKKYKNWQKHAKLPIIP